jgi:hypothetical protein
MRPDPSVSPSLFARVSLEALARARNFPLRDASTPPSGAGLNGAAGHFCSRLIFDCNSIKSVKTSAWRRRSSETIEC